MNERILDILLDYIYLRKRIDEEYINNLVNEVVVNKNLDAYYHNCLFYDKFKHTASYNPFSKNLFFSLPKMKKDIENSFSVQKENYRFNILEEKMHIPIFITLIVLHELLHMNHLKIYDEKLDDLESQLIRLCYHHIEKRNEYSSLPFKFVNPYYYKLKSYYKNKISFYALSASFAPHERLAQLGSLKEILYILKPIQRDIPNLMKYLQATYQVECLRNYMYKESIIVSPTIKYLDLVANNSKIMCFDKYLFEQFLFYTNNPNESLKKSIENYDLEERLLCGLPITQQEFVSLQISRTANLERIVK